MQCYCVIHRMLVSVLFQMHICQVYSEHRELWSSVSIPVILRLLFKGMSWLGLQAIAIGRREKQLSWQLLSITGGGKQIFPLNKITEGWEITAATHSDIALCCLPYGATSVHDCTAPEYCDKIVSQHHNGTNSQLHCCSPAPLDKVFFMSLLEKVTNLQHAHSGRNIFGERWEIKSQSCKQ